MSYQPGQGGLLPLGKGALRTDDAQDDIPITNLIQARNVTIRNGVLEKDFGSKRWNPTALPGRVLAFYDWWPNDFTQLVVVACSDGKLYQFTDPYNFEEIVPIGAAQPILNIAKTAHFVQGGQESLSRPRKLFFFSGNDQIQVISGDIPERRNLGDVSQGAPSGSGPSVDWTVNNYPKFGFIHRNRFFVLGNGNQPHMAYASSPTNNEDFITTVGADKFLTYNIYPGEHDRLLSAFVYKGKVFMFKYPSGVYGLVENDDLETSYFQRLNSDFGAASPHACVQAKDDLLVANTEGSITSILAAFQLGDIKASDLMTSLRNENFMRIETNQLSIDGRWGIYYPDKKQIYYTYQSSGGYRNDRICTIDLTMNVPQMTWNDKDQPNCLGLIRDIRKIMRPYYGSDDGHLYMLDAEDRRGPLSTPNDFSVSTQVAGAIDVGDHYYAVTFYDDVGETPRSALSNVVNISVGNEGAVIPLPIDKTGRAVGRKIYRTEANSSVLKLLATVTNNTDNEYVDILADSALGANYSVTGNTTYSGYEMIAQTPHTNGGNDLNKNFQFLEVTFEATGNWNLEADIVIDGIAKQTVNFPLYYGVPLDSFVLDQDELVDRAPRTVRKKINGQGRRISIRFRQSGYLQQVKLSSCRIYFEMADERQKAQTN